tara:strand:- start:2084 stop:2836 length:753 start_codon:yes stop_codon:yes gene_type:complete
MFKKITRSLKNKYFNTMVKIKKYKNKKEEVLSIENPEIISDSLSKSEDFINKNKTLLSGILGFIVIAVLAISVFNYFKTNQNTTAQEEMFQAVYYFESDSLVKALNGDGNNYGFLEIIDEFNLSEAANLAYFYTGSSYLKLEDYDNAIRYLKNFNSNDYFIQARAYSLIGDAYVELGDYDNAISYFKKASSYEPNEFFTPNYLLKLALVYEELSDFNSALDCYIIIINDFKDSSEYQISLKNKARLEAKI